MPKPTRNMAGRSQTAHRQEKAPLSIHELNKTFEVSNTKRYMTTWPVNINARVHKELFYGLQCVQQAKVLVYVINMWQNNRLQFRQVPVTFIMCQILMNINGTRRNCILCTCRTHESTLAATSWPRFSTWQVKSPNLRPAMRLISHASSCNQSQWPSAGCNPGKQHA